MSTGSPEKNSAQEIIEQPHHKQLEFCLNRPRYRQGRKLTSVKVYTVNDESKYLLIIGVPKINIENELKVMCQKFGPLENVELLSDYPCEEFSCAYLVKYKLIKNARFAKKQIDGRSFFGKALHVCYAPEHESVDDVREKLLDRRKSVMNRLRDKKDVTNLIKYGSKMDFSVNSTSTSSLKKISEIIKSKSSLNVTPEASQPTINIPYNKSILNMPYNSIPTVNMPHNNTCMVDIPYNNTSTNTSGSNLINKKDKEENSLQTVKKHSKNPNEILEIGLKKQKSNYDYNSMTPKKIKLFRNPDGLLKTKT